MKRRKPQPPKDQHHADQKSSETAKESHDTQVHVKGRVKIDFVDELKDQHESERREDKTSKDQQLLWTKIGAVLILFYTAVAFVQACYNGDIAKSNQQQIRDSEAVQVARLGFEDFHAELVPGPAFVADITLSVVNYGQTAASDVSFSYQMNTKNLQPSQSLPSLVQSASSSFNPPEASGGNLGPGKTRTYKFRAQTFMDAPSVDDVRQGKIAISVFYTVKYKDIFGKTVEVPDCATYNPAADHWFACLVPGRPANVSATAK